MADLPYMPMFVADYEAATSHLTLAEDGAYSRLLRLCWMTPGCSVPNDPAWIARRMRIDAATYDAVVAPIIAEFFDVRSNRISQKRLTKEFEHSQKVSKARKEAGKKGGAAKARKSEEKDAGKAKDLPEQKRGKALALTPTVITPPNGGGAAAPVDVRKEAYDRGKALLVRNGTTPKSAGAIITKWVSQRDAQWVLDAVIAADEVADPISWIQARMKAKASVEDEARELSAATARRYRAADMGEPPEHMKRELGWID